MIVDTLSGKPAPKLPAAPGRVHRLHDEPTAEHEWLDLTATELARELGCSRQAAWQRQARLRARLASTTEGTT
ncbi:MAG: HTH domain-containing protein [Burkholderiaceae bacterium]|nr:HTH domain-containing protein [Rhodoferax sp.]MCP5284205.1 HTH domain-containing protein [Burkholderiaceae bacterium]